MSGFPTIHDLINQADCLVLGHNWAWINKTTRQCLTCQERRKQ